MVWARMTGQGVPGGWGGSPCHDVLSWGSLTFLWGSISRRLGSWPLPRLPHTLGLPPHPDSHAGRKDKAGAAWVPDKAAKPRGGHFGALCSQARGETAGTGSLHASPNAAPARAVSWVRRWMGPGSEVRGKDVWLYFQTWMVQESEPCTVSC